MATIEQIRQANDIVDVVSSYMTLKRTGQRLKALCPFHREKTPSFTVNSDKQVFHCFGCGAGGDVFKFVQQIEHVDFPDALRILAERAGITLQEKTAKIGLGGEAGPGKTDLERANRWAGRWFQQQLESPGGEFARRYVADRGISRESVQKFGIGFAPDSWEALSAAARNARVPAPLLIAAGLARLRDDGSSYDAFRNRLMFPIRDAMDRTIGFGGRTLGDDPAKYVNSPQSALFDKGRCLYGLSAARKTFGQERTAVVVEGYVDCIMAQQHGFENTVATLGTAMTVEHVRLLQRYVDRVILVFDSDEAGQRAADGGLQILGCRQNARRGYDQRQWPGASISASLGVSLDIQVACVPEGKDPADYLVAAGSEAFRGVLTSAVDALELKWNQVRRQYQDAATGPGRLRAIEDFLGLVGRSVDFAQLEPMVGGFILNRVGKLLGLSGEDVNRQLRIIARRLPARDREAAAPTAILAAERSSDAGDAAMRCMLGVVVNDSSFYPSVEEEFEPELLADEGLREAARVIASIGRDKPGFRVTDVVGLIESVESAGHLMALQAEWEARGDFATSIEGALACVRRCRERQKIAQLAAQAKSDDKKETACGGVGAEASELAVLRAASPTARRVKQLMPRRYIAARLAAGSGPSEAPGA